MNVAVHIGNSYAMNLSIEEKDYCVEREETAE
jgi:hypothetical protein